MGNLPLALSLSALIFLALLRVYFQPLFFLKLQELHKGGQAPALQRLPSPGDRGSVPPRPGLGPSGQLGLEARAEGDPSLGAAGAGCSRAPASPSELRDRSDLPRYSWLVYNQLFHYLAAKPSQNHINCL